MNQQNRWTAQEYPDALLSFVATRIRNKVRNYLHYAKCCLVISVRTREVIGSLQDCESPLFITDRDSSNAQISRAGARSIQSAQGSNVVTLIPSFVTYAKRDFSDLGSPNSHDNAAGAIRHNPAHFYGRTRIANGIVDDLARCNLRRYD